VTPRMPPRRMTSNARDGLRAFIVFTHSSRTRSGETFRNVSSVGEMASNVSGSSSSSRVATKRAARRTRSPSSEKRARALPTARRRFSLMSFCPPNGSITERSNGSTAIAFTVKSRRARSCSRSSTNSTESGRRPSEYAPSPRRVVTSIGSFPTITVTVPWSMPVGIVRGKIFMTSSGSALVARSQSV
jgi:hypothetical protein